MQGITTEETKGNNAPSNRDVDLTYAKSSSETADASSKHERANIGHRKVSSFHDLCSTPNATDPADRVR